MKITDVLKNIRKKKLQKDMSEIDDEIRRITIDINQAGNYHARGDEEGFEKNLHAVIDEVQEILKKI